MGNEGSALPGLELDSKAILNTEGWTLHSATANCSASPTLSVFCGRQGHDHSSSNSLEHLVKVDIFYFIFFALKNMPYALQNVPHP